MRYKKNKIFKILFSTLLFCMFTSFFSTSFSDTNDADDPSRTALGARAVGLGNAYVGYADDVLSIFNNPAGLSFVNNLQLTSLSGKFLGEFNYLNLGAATPTKYGGVGLGYVGSGISFTIPQGNVELPDGRIVPSTSESVTYDQSSQVFMLSWGNEIPSPIKKLSIGATLKVFSYRLSGPGITNGTASGNEVDLGMKYDPDAPYSAGVFLTDALPVNLGGKITWGNGTIEKFPAIAKVGGSLNILGKKGVKHVGEHELNLNLDGEFYVTKPNMPLLFHTGVEWSPFELIEIRGGIDQTLITENNQLTAANNLTAGIGLYFNDFRFDYAFHQYNQVSSNDTHYLSISYGVGKLAPPEKKKKILVPIGGSHIFYDSEITISNKISSNDIKKVLINGISYPIENSYYQATLPLEYGRNVFKLQGFDSRNNLITAEEIAYVRLKSFSDIPQNYWAKRDIEYLATLGILKGFGDGTFRPDEKINRFNIMRELVDLYGYTSNESELLPFVDVTPSSVECYPYVLSAYNAGVVKGYPDNTVRPYRLASRIEGLIMSVRAATIGLSKVDERPFQDIAARHWGIKEVMSAKQNDLLSFALENFYPADTITRAEISSIIARLKLVKDKISEMTGEML
ncbi:MAG: S-layer homology domain-containing protein [Candidatus Margulisiibacteriota bacterium]